MNKIASASILSTLVIITFLTFFHPIHAITQDLGRHIKMGEIILATKSVPKINLFSYTYPNYPFVNHHWLSEVIFYAVNKVVGFNGLLLFASLVGTLSFAILFYFCLKQKVNLFVLGFASLFYLRLLWDRTEVRPEIFSFFLIALFLIILYNFRSHCHSERSEESHSINNLFVKRDASAQPQHDKWMLIFILPFLELLWVNLHIYFPIGLLLIALFLLDCVISNWKNINYRYTSILVVTLVGCTLATLFNPDGLTGALLPFKVLSHYGYSIEENQSIFFLQNLYIHPTILFFLCALFILFIGLIITHKKIPIINFLLSIVFSVLAIVAVRNFSLFVFATFIPFVHATSRIFGGFKIQKDIFRFILILLFCLLSLLYLYSFTKQKGVGFGQDVGPKPAADFLIRNRITGPIFNNFDIGSYLNYRLYPNQLVFVDGRPEAYPVSFFQNVYVPMQQDPTIFTQEENFYRFTTIFFAYRDQTPWAGQFISTITKNPSWKLVYLDDFVFIMIKDLPRNTNLIRQFSLTEKNFLLDTSYANPKESLTALAVFTSEAGWRQKESQILQKLIAVDPHNCAALSNLTKIFLDQNSSLAQMYLEKYQQFCQ